jgi:WS/DGAT/MGAT family acyltransferase
VTTETTVKQLPDGDAVFLSTETDTAWGHIGGMSILDPDRRGRLRLREARARDRAAARARAALPLEAARGAVRARPPYWVECADFDVRKHVHRIAVPAPGTMKELGELAGHLFARPLDRSRPLWEVWYIEGLADGKVAMFMKNHHCLMDGQAGVGLAEVLTDLSPDATAPPIVPDVMKEGRPRRRARSRSRRTRAQRDSAPGTRASSTSGSVCARLASSLVAATATSSRRRRGATCRRSRSTSWSACGAASRARRSISRSSRTSRSTST